MPVKETGWKWKFDTVDEIDVGTLYAWNQLLSNFVNYGALLKILRREKITKLSWEKEWKTWARENVFLFWVGPCFC